MHRSLRRFGADRKGTFAVATAIAAVPLALAIGLAVDVTTISNTRSVFQQALDAAALGIAREGVTISDADAMEIAGEFVRSNFAGPYSDLKIKRTGTSFRVEGRAQAETSFGKLFGYDKWPVNGAATADIAYLAYEIALVLDTTGSMNENGGGKLKSMKDAVSGLIDMMAKEINNKDNLKFALVPFAAFVNVGPKFGPAFDKAGHVVANSGAPWLDAAARNPIAQTEMRPGMSRFEVFQNLKQKWAGCVETRPAAGGIAYDTTDAPANAGKPESLFVPALSIDEPDSGSSNSYIASSVELSDGSAEGEAARVKKYGLVPKGGSSSLNAVQFLSAVQSGSTGLLKWSPVSADLSDSKGPNKDCTVQPITPLSNNYSGLKLQVQNLEADGNTNIGEGVAWGWRVLSPGEPFTQGASKTAHAKKILIVLTDGSNNFGVRDGVLGSTYTSYGFAADQRLVPLTGITEEKTEAAMNEKTLAACANAKADDLEIYTIRLEEPDKTTGMMLKDCADDADHFFDAPSHEQLKAVFGKIRDKIVSVRITS